MTRRAGGDVTERPDEPGRADGAAVGAGAGGRGRARGSGRRRRRSRRLGRQSTRKASCSGGRSVPVPSAFALAAVSVYVTRVPPGAGAGWSVVLVRVGRGWRRLTV